MLLIRPKIIADEAIPFLRGEPENYADIIYRKGSEISLADVRNADALFVRTRTKCGASLLGGSKVQFIATATIGSDHIDLEYCRRNNIEVVTAAGCNARGVLQYIMGALAELSLRDGWKPEEKTIGIIGMGNVGSLIAEYCGKFGFKVLCCDPPKKYALENMNADINFTEDAHDVLCTQPDNSQDSNALSYISLDELLPQCDIVTLHVPLNREGKYKTSGMADDAFFAKMPTGSTFINSSRGEVVNDQALIHALKMKHIKDAVIDTWNKEPEINKELLHLATFATPHIAGYSIQGKANGTAMVVRALSRHFGLPLTKWYPPQVEPSHPDPCITWAQLLQTIKTYFDITSETAALKANPGLFEHFRNNYNYRTEYF